MPVIVINPNTSTQTTQKMLAIAQAEAGGLALQGLTAPFGADLITDEAALEIAGQAILSLAPDLGNARAVIIAAFGDPARAELAARLSCPVTGIAEAAFLEAAAAGHRFGVVTTTPALVAHISRSVPQALSARFAGVYLTKGDAQAITNGATGALVEALLHACQDAISDGRAEAIIIGGGPLAVAARQIGPCLPVPLIEPVPAAMRLTRSRLADFAAERRAGL